MTNPQPKTLKQWSSERGWSWEATARELSLKTMEMTGRALYSARLGRLRQGLSKARPEEVRALVELTGYEVDSFLDDRQV